MPDDETHECPIDRCVLRVASHQLMCRKHWKLVPTDVGRRLYGAWGNGRGAGTPEHHDAMQAAIHAVEAKLAER